MRAKVYSYLRFSDAKQAAGASSERQRAYAQEWAKQNGLRLDESLSMRDEGLSAFHQKHVKRGALGAFLKAIEDEKVPIGSVLVVEGLDRLSRAEPMVAQGLELDVISACVLGGVSLTGGVGQMSHVIAGVLIMGTVRNAMNLLNLGTFDQMVASGLILLAAVAFDRLKQHGAGR